MQLPDLPPILIAQVKQACKKYASVTELGKLPIASVALRAVLAQQPDHPTDQAGQGMALQHAITICLKKMETHNPGSNERERYICLYGYLYSRDPFQPSGIWNPVHKAVESTYRISRTRYYNLLNEGHEYLCYHLSRYFAEQTLLEPVPIPHYGFVGRRKEQLYYKRRLARQQVTVIEGIGGIGKTALAAQLARTADRPVCWYVIRPGINDDRVSLLSTWGAFLARHDYPRLWALLHAHDSSADHLHSLLSGQVSELVLALRQGISTVCPLLCLDNVDALPEHATWFWSLLDSLLEEPDVRLLLTSRTRPPLRSIDDYRSLEGFSTDDVRRFVRKHALDLTSEQATAVTSYTGGNPRLLELWIALHLHTPETDVDTSLKHLASHSAAVDAYLSEEILSHLTPGELCTLQVLALARRPISASLLQNLPEHLLLSTLDVDVDQFVELHRQGMIINETREQWLVSPLLQTYLCERIPAGQRQVLHRYLARLYEVEGTIIEQAYHLAQSGDTIGALLTLAERKTLLTEQGQIAPLLHVLNTLTTAAFDSQSKRLWRELRTELFRLLGMYDEAAQEAQHASQEATTPTAQAHALRAMGEVAELRRDMQQATDYYRRALTLLTRRDQTLELWLRRDLAWVTLEQGQLADTDKELARFTIALEKWQGALAESRGHYQQALTHLNQAARIAEQYQLSMERAPVSNNRALLYRKMGAYDQAIAEYQEAIQWDEATNVVAGRVDSLLGLGVCYYQQGHYAQAIDIEQQALHLCTTQGSVGMEVLVCCQLAEAYLASGQQHPARTYAERAVAIDQELARPHDYAEAQRIYADVLLAFRELDAALTAAASAYTIIQPMLEESAAEQETAYYVLTTLQHVHAARGEHEQAAAWAAQAAALHEDSDSAAS